MKQRIRLTESDLHRIVRESVKRTLLKESVYDLTPQEKSVFEAFDELDPYSQSKLIVEISKNGDFGLDATDIIMNLLDKENEYDKIEDLAYIIWSYHLNEEIIDALTNKWKK